jgi:hypothetical protein
MLCGCQALPQAPQSCEIPLAARQRVAAPTDLQPGATNQDLLTLKNKALAALEQCNSRLDSLATWGKSGTGSPGK